MVLFLNDVAGSEILVILLFVLIFFGSKSIPTLAKTLGKTFRQINDAKNEIQGEIKKSTGDFKKDINLQGLLRETEDTIRQPLDQMSYDLEDAVKYERKPVYQAQDESEQGSESEILEETQAIEEVEVATGKEAPKVDTPEA